MFFPYRARIALFHTPVLTIPVCALCFAIFTAQYNNQRALYQSASQFCEREIEGTFSRALKWLGGTNDPRLCTDLMLRLYHSRDEKVLLAALVERHANRGITGALAAHYEQALMDTFQSFRLQAPRILTARLWYPPDSWNPLRMLTASVAHGTWAHLMGNLFFFYAFAATIEILLGPILFLAVFIALALGKDIGGAPVVTDDNTIVGMISELALIDVVFDAATRQAPVSQYMTQEIHVVHPDESLTRAAKMFALYSFRRLPVVHDGKLIGVVSRRDLMNHALRTKETLREPLFELIPELANLS